MNEDEFSDQALELAQSVFVHLKGKDPNVVGAALADLLARWLAGHFTDGGPAADEALREDMLTMHLDLVRQLIPVNEKDLSSRRETHNIVELGRRSH